MSNETKLFRLSGSALVIDLRTGHNATLRPGLVVLSEDAHTHAMGALEAECERFRELAKANGRALGDALRDYDALAAELAAIRAAGGEAVDLTGEYHSDVNALLGRVAAMAAELEKWRQQFACMQLQRDHHRNTAKALRAELEAARKQEPFWYAVVSEGAPVIDKAIRREDVAQEYADKCSEHRTGVEVIPLYRLPPLAGQVSVPDVCDGREQEAFEAFAKRKGMDTSMHPLHWLFLNRETYAARQGWKAAIRYCRALLATPSMEVKHDA